MAIDCACSSFYIGQTRHNVVKRLDEHQTSLKWDVCDTYNSIQAIE